MNWTFSAPIRLEKAEEKRNLIGSGLKKRIINKP